MSSKSLCWDSNTGPLSKSLSFPETTQSVVKTECSVSDISCAITSVMPHLLFGWCVPGDGMFPSGWHWLAAWKPQPAHHCCIKCHHLGPATSSLASSCQFCVYSAFLNKVVSILRDRSPCYLFLLFSPISALFHSHLIPKTLGPPSWEDMVMIIHFCIEPSQCLKRVYDHSSIISLIPTVPVFKDHK